MNKPSNSQPVFGESGSGCTFINTGNGISIRVDNPPTSASAHPFKVRLAGKVGDDFKFSVTPGTINNLVPEVYDTEDLMTKQPRPLGTWTFGAGDFSWLYLKIGNTGSPNFVFPDGTPENAGYPMVKAYNAQQTSTDADGFILLAAAHKDPETEKVTLFQFVNGSLWGDRIKVGSNVAQYFFARI